jgi:hypothetical protein
MCPRHWNIRKSPHAHSQCDMYWISPANQEAHFELQSILGSGGFDVVLKEIASVLHSHVKRMTI